LKIKKKIPAVNWSFEADVALFCYFTPSQALKRQKKVYCMSAKRGYVCMAKLSRFDGLLCYVHG
jgi:hypothetical protein